MMNSVASEPELLNMLRQRIAEVGGQAEFAQRLGVRKTKLNDCLHGRRGIPPAIVRALGFERVRPHPRGATRMYRKIN